MRKIYSFLLLAILLSIGKVWADETPAYSLTFTKLTSGTNYNSYTAAHSITVSSKEWSLIGNQSVGAYIRVGGKNTTALDRTLTSTDAIVNKKIYKVIINHTGVSNGTNSSLSVNSITVEGSTSSDFSKSVISKTISSPSVSSSGSISFEPDNVWAENSYFRIKVNCQITGSNNCGLNINSVNFYEYIAPEISASDVNIAADILGGNISYTITNPDGSSLTAAKKSGGDWLTVGDVDAINKKVAFTAEENADTENSRSGVITLTYGSVTKDVTITQAAAATKYTVTYTASPSNGTLVVKRGETTVSSGTQVSDGTILTIEATPSNAHDYALSKWEYKEGEGSWTDGVGTSYTINGKNVEFRATFVARIYHNITYSVNDATTVVEVEQGDNVSFAAPASGIPTGYAFKGWRTSTLASTDTDPNDYVTSAKSTTDITYYAVMAVEHSGTGTWTLDYEEDNQSGKSVKDDITLGYGSPVDYTAADGSKWTIKASKQTGMQINKSKNASIKVPSCSGKITSIALTLNSGATNKVGFSASDYTGGDIGDVDYLAVASSAGTSQTLDLVAENALTGYVVPNGGNAQITKIVVTYYKPTYSGYCSTTFTVPVSVGTAGYKTYVCNTPINFTDASIEAYIVTGTSGDKVTLTQVNKVPANEAVLLFKDGGATENIPMFDGTGADDVSENLLAVSDGTKKGNGTSIYALAKKNSVVGFYIVGDGVKIPAGKAYLDLGGSPAPSLLRIADEEENATSIESIEQTENAIKFFKNGILYIKRDGVVYDALGRAIR